jgi:hypothetical protein
MSQTQPYGYYYGNEADQYTFYRLPKALFTDDRYKDLSDGAKILYGLMLDRMGLSVRNGWTDEQNRVYIIFTQEDAQEYMNCKHDKAIKMFAELNTNEGVGLIERVRQGQGKPAIIYVRKFFNEAEPMPTSRHRESRHQEVGKTDIKRSEKSKSRSRENRSQDIGKTDSNKNESNNNELNNIDFNDTDSFPSHSPPPASERVNAPERKGTETKSTQAFEIYRDIIWENLDYDIMVERFPYDKESIDGIVDLMLETVCTARKTIRIAGDDYPAELVKAKFLKLNGMHLEFVLDCMKKNTTEIRSIKKYLLAVLFNAPSTIDSYYTALVAHDMASGKI